MNELLAFVLGALASAGVAVLIHRRRRPAFEPERTERDADRERRRTEVVLERMDEGVVLLDDRLQPVFANGAAATLLGLPRDTLPRRLPNGELAMLAWRSLREGRSLEQVLELWFPSRSHLRVHAAPLEDATGIVVVVQDVTQEVETQRLRREFVAHASHELKSPVTGLQVLAEAVRDAAGDDPAAAAGFADRMVAETGRLSRLITDLLDLSRLEEAGRVPDAPVDLSAVVESEASSASYAAEGGGVTLKSAVEPGVWVRGEKAQLGNLVRNLLDNAVRYTPDGGTVSVTLARADGAAVLTVADDGIGIPVEEQERVFERFYRVDRARARHTGGTGLGLAIVKHIAELHGGSVGVDSELGRGSAFEVRIPALAGTQNVRSIAG